MNQEKKWYKRGNALIHEISNSQTEPGRALLWFLGQTGFVIKLNNIILYIDAILHNYQNGENSPRLSPPPFLPQTSVPADFFLCTHNHSDHLNLETLVPQAQGNAHTRFIIPAPSAPCLIEGGISPKRIIKALAGITISAGNDVSITPIAAAHSEYSTDEMGNDFYLGYIIRGNGITIYHAGDGIVTNQLLTTLLEHRPIDIALLPINGMDWERTAQGIIGNMNSEDAAKFARAIDIDLTIPTHFDFLEGNTVNPAHFTDVFYTICPEKKFHILALGERFIYQKS